MCLLYNADYFSAMTIATNFKLSQQTCDSMVAVSTDVCWGRNLGKSESQTVKHLQLCSFSKLSGTSTSFVAPREFQDLLVSL